MPFPRFLLRWMFLNLILWITVSTIRCQAQSTGIDPTFNVGTGANGTVKQVVVQDDGKVIIVGDFTTVNNVARIRVARLNSDGSLDATFDPGVGPNALVRCVMLQTDGKIVIGGDFTSVAGPTRNRIARLSSTGVLDATFLPGATQGANGPVYALANYKGYILAGGSFTIFNNSAGTSNSYVVFINPDSGELMSFAAGLNGPVYAIAPISSSGQVYLGGAFTTVNNGTNLPHLARFGATGAMDFSFNPSVITGGNVTSLAVDLGQGNVFAAGDFTTVNGLPRPGLAFFSQFGTVSTQFTPGTGPNGPINSLAYGYNGQLIVGGSFTSFNGSSASNLVELNQQTGDILSAAVTASAAVHSIANESDGKLFVAGDFTSIAATGVNRIARLYGPNGSALPSTPSWLNVTQATDTQLIVTWATSSYLSGYKLERSLSDSGVWTQVAPPAYTTPYIDSGLTPGAQYRYRVRAYSTNGDGGYSPVGSASTLATPWVLAGSPDNAFASAVGTGANSYVNSSAIQTDGKILLGGSFNTFNGASHNDLVRLNADGSTDTTFTTSVWAFLYCMAIQPNGKIIVGGYLQSVNGITRTNIARLNTDGSLDITFNPGTGPNSQVESVAAQPDGKVLLAGRFSSVNGTSRNGIARLNTDGSLDTTFNPGTGLSFADGYKVALQSDGKVIVVGFFQKVNGVKRGNIARFLPDGSLDTAFAAGTGADGWVEDLQLLPDGRCVIVGPF